MTTENTSNAGADYVVQYHVTIDGSSPLAKIHESGAANYFEFPRTETDGSAESGQVVRHPVLYCSAVDVRLPQFLGVVLGTTPGAVDPDPQMVWIPYAHVLLVVEVRVPIAQEPVIGDEDGKVVPITSASGKSASRYLN